MRAGATMQRWPTMLRSSAHSMLDSQFARQAVLHLRRPGRLPALRANVTYMQAVARTFVVRKAHRALQLDVAVTEVRQLEQGTQGLCGY